MFAIIEVLQYPKNEARGNFHNFVGLVGLILSISAP